MDKQINITNKDNNITQAAEQWFNLALMLIKIKRQQKMAQLKIKNNDYEHR